MNLKSLLAPVLLSVALPLCAADTNAPAAKDTNVLAKIPDASEAPVRVTNIVTIAGEKVKYVAETGMLPLLKPDGLLFVGHSENFYHAAELFTLKGKTVYVPAAASGR